MWLASKIPVFEPDRPIFLVFDCFLLLYLLMVCCETFLKLSFHLTKSNFTPFFWFIFEAIPPYIFTIEILISLNTSYYSKGIYIVNRWKILKHYIKYDFLTDLLTLMPLYMSMNSLSEFLDLIFTFRIIRTGSILKRIEEYLQLRGKKEGLFRLAKLIVNVLFLAHLSACTWHFLGDWEVKNGYSDNWLVFKGLVDSDWVARYIYSLYFAIVTMVTVGYGDISSQNSTECTVNIILIIYGCAVFAFTINEIGMIFKEMYQEEKAFK